MFLYTDKGGVRQQFVLKEVVDPACQAINKLPISSLLGFAGCMFCLLWLAFQ